MKPTIFMPKTIKAGFRNTGSTLTGKLAYVIYYDEKGNLRKEKSWNNWRQEHLGSEDFENKPTRGFFVNKKIGGHKSGWNYRQSYIRIYDPRGFEFEITVENLIYILEYVGSDPENGLEGEFVYGWDKADLVLIPTNSPDYKEIQEYNEILQGEDSKIFVKDLTIGGTYKHKNNIDYVYIGRKDVWELNHRWRNKYETERTNHKGKYHTFVKKYEAGEQYRDEIFFKTIEVKSPSGVFIQEVSSNKSPDLDEIMEYINGSYRFNAVDEEATELIRLTGEKLKKYLDNRRTVYVNEEWYFTGESYLSEEKGIYRIYKKGRRIIKDNVLAVGTFEELEGNYEIYDMKHYLTNGKELLY